MPERDSAQPMQYAINSKVFNDGVTETINLFNVRNGFWLSIPQDTLMLAKYRGKNKTTGIDTLLTINNGNVSQSYKGNLTWSWNQITGKPTFFNGDYSTLTNKPAIPTMFPDSVKYYNASGPINQKMKVWVGRVAITSAQGQTIDISSAGFNNIVSIQALAERNTTTATSVPNPAVKSYSNTSVSFNIIEGSTSLVTLLTIPVLGGPPYVFANTTGLFLHVIVTGY